MRCPRSSRTPSEHRFHVWLANDYDPASYPAALRKPVPPVRWRGPVTEMTDLVLSRIDGRWSEA
ncbi:hypothetical protein [Streptomyces sp. NBC_00057]|uniref:hypothetical protein n=1 Tax=Streptomyces sp. NBC_00057 TaxID=2975634 RepID=UPI00324C19EC